jgi:hypothetical protein
MQQDCGLLIAVCISVLLVGLFVWDALWVNNKTRITYVKYDASRVEGDYPVDAVYTWVNPADEAWKQAYAATVSPTGSASKRRFNNNTASSADAELQTSLELLVKHCPWVRTIYIATMRPQVPACLSRDPLKQLVDSGRVRVVHHDEFFEDPAALPVFCSRAIEANLHRIPALSAQWLYLNDDFMTGRPVEKNMLFYEGKPVIRGMWMPVYHGLKLDAHVDGCVNNGKLLNKLWYFHNDHTTTGVTTEAVQATAQWAGPVWKHTSGARLRAEGQIVPQGLVENAALDSGMYVCYRNNPLKTYAMLAMFGFMMPKPKRFRRYHFFCVNNIPPNELVQTINAIRRAFKLEPLTE